MRFAKKFTTSSNNLCVQQIINEGLIESLSNYRRFIRGLMLAIIKDLRAGDRESPKANDREYFKANDRS